MALASSSSPKSLPKRGGEEEAARRVENSEGEERFQSRGAPGRARGAVDTASSPFRSHVSISCSAAGRRQEE